MNWIIRASGPFAMWTPPAFRSERHSQIIGSHDAGVGLFRGIMGHLAVNWFVTEVHILAEPRYIIITQNELKFNGPGPYTHEKQHTQRTNVYLRNVDYLFIGHMELSSNANPPEDTIPKFDKMFAERAKRGRQRRQVYFGIRECMALVELHEGPLPKAIDLTQDLGLSYFGTDFTDPRQPQYFAPLQVKRGVVHYPSWEEVKKWGIMKVKEVA